MLRYSKDFRRFFTPKALYSIAQGRGGNRASWVAVNPNKIYTEGVKQRRREQHRKLYNTFGVSVFRWIANLGCAATPRTLGFGI